jgi:hypothetical protein
MRRAASLVLFVLLAVAMVLCQTAARTGSNPSTAPQAQAPPSGTTAAPANQTENQNPPLNPGSTTAPASPQGNTSGQAGMVDQIASGAEIRATLDTPLSTRTSRPGDRFTATVAIPARGSNGAVVIPSGARVEGEVAEPEEEKTLAALRDKGVLSLRFRDLVLPNGQTLPLAATLISVNGTNPGNAKNADEEGQTRSGARGRDVAKDRDIEAAPGTGAGPVFGSPLKGLAIGALSGGGYVVATKGKDVRLPAETGMVIRLDQPVSASVSGTLPR